MRKRQKRNEVSGKKIVTIKRFFVLSVIIFALCILASFVVFIQHVFSQSSHTIVNPSIAEMSVDEVTQQLTRNNITVDSIKTTDGGDTYTVQISQGPKVVLSRVKDMQFQIDTLVELLSRLSVDNKKPVSIEFQYSKPIVKF